MTSRSRRDQGFALVTALWAALMLSLVVSFTVRAGYTDARIAHTAIKQAGLQALAEGAIEITKLRLLAPLGVQGIPLDGTPAMFAYGGHQVRIAIQDQAGLIDLNFASGEMLRQLFETAGVKSFDAQALADSVMDWREKGDGRRLNGAKASEYATTNHDYGPREAPFESVAELNLVSGMTSNVFDRVESSLTVYSQKSFVDQQSAPELVLKSLPGMTSDSAAEVLRQRLQLQEDNASAQRTAVAGHALALRAVLANPDGSGASVTVMVRVIGSAYQPFWYYGKIK